MNFKWLPVLQKCTEYKNNYALSVLNDALENQFKEWTRDKNQDQVVDFARFALPIVRRVIYQLLERGFVINVVDDAIAPVLAAQVSENEINIVSKTASNDREIMLCDLIAARMTAKFIELFPEKKIDLQVLLVVKPNSVLSSYSMVRSIWSRARCSL